MDPATEVVAFAPNTTADLETGGPEKPRRWTSSRSATAYLDGVRGLAALLVYVSHHAGRFYGIDSALQRGFGWRGTAVATTLPFVRVFFTGGAAAVAIFFVLSGFVLSRSTLALDRPQARWSLVVKRPFRLFIPPAGVSLCVALIMQLPESIRPHFSWPPSQANVFAELGTWFVELCQALNPFAFHAITTKWFPYDPPVWTMAVEFQGSMLVYALMAVLGLTRARFRSAMLALAGLALLFAYQWAMACFVAGMFLALGHADDNMAQHGQAATTLGHVAFLFGWYLLCQPATAPGDVQASLSTPGWTFLTRLVPAVYASAEYWRFWNAVGAAAVVWAVLRLRWLQRLFAARPLRFLGHVSFSLYLTHIPFLWVFGETVYRVVGNTGHDQGEDERLWDNAVVVPDLGPPGLSTRWLVAQAVILPLNLVLAYIGTVLLDEPSVRVGKWAAARFGQ